MSLTDLIVHAGPMVGYVLIFLIIFAESGFFIFFFLPGDSLLFTVGILASKGHFSFLAILLVGGLAALFGDLCGYLFGRSIGESFFNRPNSLLFKKENVVKAHAFYEEYGKVTIILARFTPLVRSFAPIIAGIAKMNIGVFMAYNIAGGITWIASITAAGYFLGTRIPNVDHYIIPIVIAVAILSAVPALYHICRSSKPKNN